MEAEKNVKSSSVSKEDTNSEVEEFKCSENKLKGTDLQTEISDKLENIKKQTDAQDGNKNNSNEGSKKRKFEETGPQVQKKRSISATKENSDVANISSNQKKNLEQSLDSQDKKNLDISNNENHDLTDEEIMNNLDEIESILSNPSIFSMNGETSNGALMESKSDWYESRLQEKCELVKERLTKLARVLEHNYPFYNKWLKAVQIKTGTPVCRLKPPKPCSLKQLHTNRWRFTCNKKIKQLPSEEESGGQERIIWTLEPSAAQDSDFNNPKEYPPFVMRAVKVFENFLATTSVECEEGLTFSREEIPKTVSNISELVAVDDKPAPKFKLEWLQLLVRCNRKNELMLVVTAENVNAEVLDGLKDCFQTGEGKECNVKSLYCQCMFRVNNTAHMNTFVMGDETLRESVGGIKLRLGPKTNFWSNAAGAESLGLEICDQLVPTPKTTVIEIGCGIGLMSLMMSNKCHKIIGLDSPNEIKEAESICQLNNIKNATFVAGSPKDIMDTIPDLLLNYKASAIINTNSHFGRKAEIMKSIRRIENLRRLVLVTTLTKQSVSSILELTKPAQDGLGDPFIPIKACVVDTLPAGPNFETVILMERKILEKIIPSLDLRVKKLLSNSIVKEPLKPEDKRCKEKYLEVINSFAHSNLVVPGIKKNENVYSQKYGLDKVPIAMKRNFSFANKNIFLEEAQESEDSTNIRTDSPEIIIKKTVIFNSQLEEQVQGKEIQEEESSFFKKHSLKQKYWDDLTKRESFDDLLTKNLREAQSVKEEEPLEESESQNEQFFKEDSPVLEFNPFSNKAHQEKRHREKKHREKKLRRKRSSENQGESSQEEIRSRKKKKHHKHRTRSEEKIKTPSVPLDDATAKQIENMLNMIHEQTTKVYNPVSVWDRIAPAPNKEHDNSNNEDGTLKYEKLKLNPPESHKYSSALPLEPNLIMPVNDHVSVDSTTVKKASKKKYRGQYRQHLMEKMNKMKAELAEKKQENAQDKLISPAQEPKSPDSVVRLSPDSVTRMSSDSIILSPERSVSPHTRKKIVSRYSIRYSPEMKYSGKYSPEMRKYSRKYSPEMRKYSARYSPEMRKYSDTYSPEMRKHFERYSPELSKYSRKHSSRHSLKYSDRRYSRDRYMRYISPGRESPISRRGSPISRRGSPISRRESPISRRESPILRRESRKRLKDRSRSPREIPRRRKHISPIYYDLSPSRHSPQRSAKSKRFRHDSSQRLTLSPERYEDDWNIPSRASVEDKWSSPLRNLREEERLREEKRIRDEKRLQEKVQRILSKIVNAKENEEELKREQYLEEKNNSSSSTEKTSDEQHLRKDESNFQEEGAGLDEASKEILSKFNPPVWETKDSQQEFIQSQELGMKQTEEQVSETNWTPLSEILKSMQKRT